jgi:pimeloyl-ACP methyl ester carboxylesterase
VSKNLFSGRADSIRVLMPYLNVDFVRLYYEINGKGFPALWLPPLLADHLSMRTFTQPFTELYTAIILDLLGHGLSDKPKIMKLYSYKNLVDHCYRLIQHLGINKHDIVGASWSGRIAILYTLLHQDKVRALVLIGSSGPKHRVANPPENSELSNMERFLVKTIWQTPYNVLDDLKNIHVPTLILIGDQDPRLEAAHLIHSNIPNSTLIIIKGYGHRLESKLCAQKILPWLRSLPK